MGWGGEEGALGEAERVLAQLEVLQRLLGENVAASIEDVGSEERVVATRDRLVGEERYQLATLLCAKCRVGGKGDWGGGGGLGGVEGGWVGGDSADKCSVVQVDPTPVYVAWGQSLLLLEKYGEARGKFK